MKKNIMKTLKFPATSATTENHIGNRSIDAYFKLPVKEISDSKNIYETRISRRQIIGSRKFKIALFAAYSSLLVVFALIVYTAIVLDPRFPF
jgi:hypothetical protein